MIPQRTSSNSFIRTSLFRINSPCKVFPLSKSSAERLCHFTPSQLIYDKPHVPTPRPRQFYFSSSALPTRPKKSYFIILHHVSFTILEAVDLKNSHNLKVEELYLFYFILGLQAWETASQVTLREVL